MFSGIIQGSFPATFVVRLQNIMQLKVELAQDLLCGLTVGASVAVNGVCLTVTAIEKREICFDIIAETLNKTTCREIREGDLLHIERSLRLGDEIGGHLLSGHVIDTAVIERIDIADHLYAMHLRLAPNWMKYIFEKGYIAVDGASLTATNVDPSGRFTVYLIPETLRLTTFLRKKVGDFVNIEIDSRTQAIVDSLHRPVER